MNYAETIYNALASAQGNPVAPLQMLQKQKPPFVVFNINSVQPLSAKVKYEPLDLVSITVMVFNQDMDTLQQEADKIRQALTCLPTVQNSWLEYSTLEYDERVKQYYIVQEYSMRFIYQRYISGGIGVMTIGSTFIVA